jgi:hypothetical protein
MQSFSVANRLHAIYLAFIGGRALPPNKQLQRTAISRRGRAGSASFHCALAARSTGQRAAAKLRR